MTASAISEARQGAPAPAGVTRIPVRDEGLKGVVYMPHGGVERPALLVLGGSEGGLGASSQVGVHYSKEGFAVMALAYVLDEGLPQSLENIPLEYFDRALASLRRQPGVDPDRIGVIGGSRGSEAALLLGARHPAVRTEMAFAPSGVVWQGLNFQNPMNTGPAWTLAGKGLPFLEPDAGKYHAGGVWLRTA